MAHSVPDIADRDTDSQLPKLTDVSRKHARSLLFWREWAFGASVAFASFGLIAAVVAASEGLGLSLPPHIIHFESDHPLDWAIFSMAAAIVGGGLIPLFEWRRNSDANRARSISEAGKVPRFASYTNSLPPNRTLYDLYTAKSAPAMRANFLIPNLPLYFLIPPCDGCDILLEFSPEPLDHEAISHDAANSGFDWGGFCDWWINEKAKEYDAVWWEDLVRAVQIRQSNKDYILKVCSTEYKEYLCTDLAANLEITGAVPSMRAFLEGFPWSCESAVDLSDLKASSGRFSMAVGVSALVVTSDGYLVMQRRSSQVQSAPGGVSGTAAGGVRWDDVWPLAALPGFRWRRRRQIRRSLPHWSRVKGHGSDVWFWRSHPSLKRGILRELSEEVGRNVVRSLVRDDKPFVGAALNLRNGRDLNFYAFFESSLDHRAIAQGRSTASDSWEVAHLLFVHVSKVRTDGTFDPPFENLLGDSRHIRGALYCMANSKKFRQVLQRFGQSSTRLGETGARQEQRSPSPVFVKER